MNGFAALLGLDLKEQSNHYATYIASIHITAMRFCMLVIANSLHHAGGVSVMRNRFTANTPSIDYAARLWHALQGYPGGKMNFETWVIK